MNTDAVLSSALQTLYPQVAMNSEAVAIITFLIVTTILMLIMFVLGVKIKDFLLSAVFFFFAVLVIAIGWNVYNKEEEKREDQMIQLLVTDPPALERILQLRESIEWINNPVMQRNKK